MTTNINTNVQPEIRALDQAELDHVTGGFRFGGCWPGPRWPFPFPRLPNPVDVVVGAAKAVWNAIKFW